MSAVKPANNILPFAQDLETVSLVRDALDHICEDPLFVDTTRMKRFLRYVVEEALEGRGNRLKGYAVGLEVFDKPEDFDPQLDTIVRVQAGQLRRRLNLYYSERGRDRQVRITIPKGSYAPVFEIRQQTSEDESKPVAEIAKLRNDDPRPSIMVIPLRDLTEISHGTGSFADGLTAEIVNALVQFRSMRVVTYSVGASAPAKTNHQTASQKDIGVDFILSGSVRRNDDVFRVMVNLIRSGANEYLFSRIFDRDYSPGNIFALQEEIASNTAAAIAAPFGAINRYNRRNLKNRPDSIHAYEGILQFYDLSISPTRNESAKLLKDFDIITQDFPYYASGWAVKSLLNIFAAAHCFPVPDVDAHFKAAKLSARKAIEIDGQNAMGYFALFQLYYHQGKMDEAERMMQRCLAINPNDYSVLAHYANCLALQGHEDRALSIQAAALRLIGRAPPWFYAPDLIVDYRKGNYKKVLKTLGSDFSNMQTAFQAFGLSAYMHEERIEEVKTLINKMEDECPNYLSEIMKSSKLWHLDEKIRKNLLEGGKIAGFDLSGYK